MGLGEIGEAEAHAVDDHAVDESWPERLPGGWEAALEGEPEAEERGEEGEDVPRKQRRHEDAIPEHVEQHQQRGVVRVRVEGVGGHHEHAGAPEERKHRGRAEQGAELACAAAQPSSKADRRNHKRLPSKEEENRVGSADHRLHKATVIRKRSRQCVGPVCE